MYRMTFSFEALLPHAEPVGTPVRRADGMDDWAEEMARRDREARGLDAPLALPGPRKGAPRVA